MPITKDHKLSGTVTELLPNSLYRVEFPAIGSEPAANRTVICYLAGKMRLNKIKVLLGDKVEVIIDPYGGKTTNRIVRRANN